MPRSIVVGCHLLEFWLESPGHGRSYIQIQATKEEMGSQFVREELNPSLLLAKNSEVKFRRTFGLFCVLKGSLSLNRIWVALPMSSLNGCLKLLRRFPKFGLYSMVTETTLGWVEGRKPGWWQHSCIILYVTGIWNRKPSSIHQQGLPGCQRLRSPVTEIDCPSILEDI